MRPLGREEFWDAFDAVGGDLQKLVDEVRRADGKLYVCFDGEFVMEGSRRAESSEGGAKAVDDGLTRIRSRKAFKGEQRRQVEIEPTGGSLELRSMETFRSLLYEEADGQLTSGRMGLAAKKTVLGDVIAAVPPEQNTGPYTTTFLFDPETYHFTGYTMYREGRVSEDFRQIDYLEWPGGVSMPELTIWVGYDSDGNANRVRAYKILDAEFNMSPPTEAFAVPVASGDIVVDRRGTRSGKVFTAREAVANAETLEPPGGLPAINDRGDRLPVGGTRDWVWIAALLTLAAGLLSVILWIKRRGAAM
ncbi:hypothetical protein CA12_33070 [Alienimonas californiensis]|uniref:Uncharacterized protein n=2 Tax=Alienimonas californiensis TaxID=2527989 RepID=A0A517PCU0_9PLAN|nr:hypothetical protein CA12_33070 [Alienimonas californiensis]